MSAIASAEPENADKSGYGGLDIAVLPKHDFSMDPDSEIIFRPHIGLLLFWFVGCGLILAFGLAVVGPILESPGWPQWFFVGGSILAMLQGLFLAFGTVRIGRDGITNRQIRRWSASWEEMEAWSRLEPHGSIYIRTRSGVVRGFSGWCLGHKNNDRLAQMLEARLGPALTGENAVMPTWMNAIADLGGNQRRP